MFDMNSEQQKPDENALFRPLQWTLVCRRHKRCQDRKCQHSHIGEDQSGIGEHPWDIASKSAGRKLAIMVPIEHDGESRHPKGAAQQASTGSDSPSKRIDQGRRGNRKLQIAGAASHQRVQRRAPETVKGKEKHEARCHAERGEAPLPLP